MTTPRVYNRCAPQPGVEVQRRRQASGACVQCGTHARLAMAMMPPLRVHMCAHVCSQQRSVQEHDAHCLLSPVSQSSTHSRIHP